LVGTKREAYLSGEPADDGRFVSVFAHSLEHIGGYTPERARRAALSLLPDVMSYDPTRPASFPSNGRTLTDDAGDAFVAVLTNGRVTEDKVGPHSDLLPEFPYVGPPHKAAGRKCRRKRLKQKNKKGMIREKKNENPESTSNKDHGDRAGSGFAVVLASNI